MLLGEAAVANVPRRSVAVARADADAVADADVVTPSPTALTTPAIS